MLDLLAEPIDFCLIKTIFAEKVLQRSSLLVVVILEDHKDFLYVIKYNAGNISRKFE